MDDVEGLAETKGLQAGTRFLSDKKKAHKHKLFGPVALGTTRHCPRDESGLSLGQTHFVPGTNPGFLLILHNGRPVCPRDKPSLSLGQSRGRRAAERVYVFNVYVPFSLAILLGANRIAHLPQTLPQTPIYSLQKSLWRVQPTVYSPAPTCRLPSFLLKDSQATKNIED